ncbi:cell division ATP-binding protein FtsE [Porticoccaceae bacterium]|nr:cell division ATP-binding protein FtsE [Porticoccaceae bacterium]
MIRFDGVSKRYSGGSEALKNVSFELAAGEMAFLTGHSGAGKSTLLKLLMVMERPSHGTILVNGHNIGRLPHSQIPYYRRQLGAVFQDHRLLTDRSVFDNIALPLQVCGLPGSAIAQRVRAALTAVGLAGLESKRPLALSGGEQQRVGIARAIVHKPRIVVADEPTGNLDPELSAEIMALFARFKQAGVAVLVATHDVELIRQNPCRVLHLDHGAMVQQAAHE